MWSNALYDYASMKDIKDFTIKHNNHGELKNYEKIFGRKLTRIDAIVISPLTESRNKRNYERLPHKQRTSRISGKEKRRSIKTVLPNI